MREVVVGKAVQKRLLTWQGYVDTSRGTFLVLKKKMITALLSIFHFHGLSFRRPFLPAANHLRSRILITRRGQVLLKEIPRAY